MKIVVAGGTGFIGEPLVRRLVERGSDVVVLTRNPAKVTLGRGVAWNPPALNGWAKEVESADVVINLAGGNIAAGRWTAGRKRRLIDSRIHSTRALVEAMKRRSDRKRTFISASAVGYYGDRGDEILDETSPPGSGFLADLVRRWEDEARGAEAISRLVIARFGVVIGRDGGALQKMLLPFKLGIGGPIGSGRQWMPWVDRDDVLRFMEWAIAHGTSHGIFNVSSPQPVRNREFTVALGRALHRPAFMPMPAFALRMVFGEMADDALLASERAVPKRTMESGFVFERPDLEVALKHAVNG